MILSELENLFQSITSAITGLDPDMNVRISWPTEGAPAWEITDNIVFLRVVTEDRPYNRQRETRYYGPTVNLIKEATFTRIASISWIIYGPNSFENAQLLRDSMFYQENHDILAENNLYLIPDIVEPKRVPELFEGRWWERVDMTMLFNEFVTRISTQEFVASAEVILQNDDGSIYEEYNVTE